MQGQLTKLEIDMEFPQEQHFRSVRLRSTAITRPLDSGFAMVLFDLIRIISKTCPYFFLLITALIRRWNLRNTHVISRVKPLALSLPIWNVMPNSRLFFSLSSIPMSHPIETYLHVMFELLQTGMEISSR